MADIGAINSAIESFENWQQPWTFFPSIVGHPKCDDDERRTIEDVWSAACDEDIWLSGASLQDCCVHADKAIAQKFSWLSVRARQQIVNGAAYQWK